MDRLLIEPPRWYYKYWLDLNFMKKSLSLAAALLFISCLKAAVLEAAKPPADLGSIVRLDPAFDTLVPKNAQIEKLVGGFKFIESPLWRPSNALWFSDVVGNVVPQWTPDGKVTDILRPGGYGGYNGSNGIIAGKDGYVLVAQHGNRLSEVKSYAVRSKHDSWF